MKGFVGRNEVIVKGVEVEVIRRVGCPRFFMVGQK